MDRISPAQMQGKDLLSQVPKQSYFTAPTGLYKSFIFDGVAVLLAVASGIFFGKLLLDQANFWISMGVIGAYVSFAILGSLLIKNVLQRTVVVALEVIAFFAPLYGNPAGLLEISIIVFALMRFWGEYLEREELSNSVEIRFFHSVRRPLSKLLTALSAVAVFLLIPQWSAQTTFVSKPTFASVFDLSVGVAGRMYPEYKFNGTAGDLASSVAKTQLTRNANYKLLPQVLKDQTLADANRQIMDSLAQALGYRIESSESLTGVAYTALNRALVSLRNKFGDIFLGIWALAAFFFIRSLAAILGYAASLLSFLIYHLMISFGMIRVRTENKPHEIVEFA